MCPNCCCYQAFLAYNLAQLPDQLRDNSHIKDIINLAHRNQVERSAQKYPVGPPVKLSEERWGDLRQELMGAEGNSQEVEDCIGILRGLFLQSAVSTNASRAVSRGLNTVLYHSDTESVDSCSVSSYAH